MIPFFALDGDAAGRLDWSVHMVDGTSIRAHHAADVKGGRKTRPSATRVAACDSKLDLCSERGGPPIAFVLTAGDRHEQTSSPLCWTLARSSAPARASRACGHELFWPITATQAGPLTITAGATASPRSSPN